MRTLIYPAHDFVLQEDWKEAYGVPTCSECSRPEWDAVHRDRFRRFLRLVGRIEERWIKTGDPELRAIADELHAWEREGSSQ